MFFKRKKAEEKDVSKMMENVAVELIDQTERQYFEAKDRMDESEKIFVQSLDDYQMKLFNDWNRKKQEFQDLFMEWSNLKKNG